MEFVCKLCGYIHNNTNSQDKFEDLPTNWICPICGSNKSDFKEKEEQ